MKFASFDIEISGELCNYGDANYPPAVSCAALALSDDTDNVRFFTSPDGVADFSQENYFDLANEILALCAEGYEILTWNGVSFDLPIIAEHCRKFDADLCYRLYEASLNRHVDMMLLVTFQTGYRLGLQAALEGAGLAGKLHNVTLNDGTPITDMSGAKAPELWRAGERNAVLQYLRDDALQPLALVEAINKNGRIDWISKKGRPMTIKTQVLTVADAFEKLPEPQDLSWMSEPVLRSEYINEFIFKRMER